MTRRRIGLALLGAVVGAFALSVALAVPRLSRHDYAATPLWRLTDGTYRYAGGPIPGLTDAQGVRVVDYGAELGRRYSPTAVAQFAISLSDRLGDARSRDVFLRQVEWLRTNAVRDARRGVIWPHDFDWPINRQRAPWVSALTQGNAISALVRAHRSTGDTAYLALARGALRVFDVDERAGGVRKTIEPGVVVYEEYPISDYVVLDGWLNALAGVQELYLATGDSTARRLLDEGVRSARVLLPRFTGRWSFYYSSRRDLPSPAYFAASYNALRYLAIHRPELREQERRWRRFIPSDFWVKWARVWYQTLNWRRLALFGVPPLADQARGKKRQLDERHGSMYPARPS